MVLEKTSPISHAFSGPSFCLVTPMCHQISGSTPTSPISPAFSGQGFSLAAPMCHQISQVKSSNPHKSYLICFQWSIAFPCCTPVPVRLSRSNPQKSYLISHLLVVIFPLPHPCTTRFPRSNLHKSYLTCFQWSLFFPCCTDVPLDFRGQIVKSPQVLPHLLLVINSFPLLRPCASQTFEVKSSQVLSHLLLVVVIFPSATCAARFPRSNPHKSYLICFQWSLFFPCRTHVPLDFPSQIVKPPQVLSHLLCSGRYSAFSHFTSFSCCVSRCVSPFCLPGAAFATAHRPDRSEQ